MWIKFNKGADYGVRNCLVNLAVCYQVNVEVGSNDAAGKSRYYIVSVNDATHVQRIDVAVSSVHIHTFKTQACADKLVDLIADEIAKGTVIFDLTATLALLISADDKSQPEAQK